MEKKIVYEDEALRYIAKFCDGGCRDAITLLDKCLSFSRNLTLENVINALGVSDYDDLLVMTVALLRNNNEVKLDIIENIYRQGKDLKQFIKQLLHCVIDINKYLRFS